ncbi:MAG: DUF58 domain-containing protein [Planctomycetes bacterium]|nr:DUF58 domain-containing protein [Planctomycetota bacterium]NUQ34183.1 DUF58 domain-containing protein [Planctomycetaceae bacterium]
MAQAYQKYLDPAVLNQVRNLEMKARAMVEGFITGMHKSPYKGFSVEFAEHREYVQGDDPRFIDWKAFGKSDKYYIKQYEEETNFRAYIVLDTSESMLYGSEGHLNKLEYARYAAASLAYLIQQQSDAAGMALFDEKLYGFVEASTANNKLMEMLALMYDHPPRGKTGVGMILDQLAERISKRALVIVISDFFDKVGAIRSGLDHLRHRKHDIILMHVMDKQETDFTFDRLTQFKGLEDYPQLLVDPRALRKAYLDEVSEFMSDLRAAAFKTRSDYLLMNTSTPLQVALQAYLAARSGGRTGRQSGTRG